jgi:hypothetical protein
MFDYKSLMGSTGKIASQKIRDFKLTGYYNQLVEETSWLPNEASIPERIYVVLNNVTTRPVCQTCGGRVNFRQFTTGYKLFCGMSCSKRSPASVEKTRITIEAAGESYYKDIVEKRRETSLVKYGLYSPNQHPDVKERQKLSKVEKYGEDYAKLNRAKSMQTVLDKYGVKNPFQLGIEKARKTKQSHCPASFALLKDKVWLEQEYKHKTTVQIAEQLGVGHSTVSRFLIAHGIDRTNWTSVSGQETEVFDFIKSIYTGEILRNDRKIIYPRELDIVIPEHQLAIEFNGVFWHSSLDDSKRKAHVSKTEEAENVGYQVLHIYSTEWEDSIKREIWKSVIRSKMGLTDKIYARKCSIESVSLKDANKFYSATHLQGEVQRGKTFGLYYEHKLVCCMTIGNSRFEKDKKELLRFSTLINTTVIGGFSKLLKNFGEEEVVSYANRRWSKAGVYERCGFNIVATTPPSMLYYVNNKLFSRQVFQKHLLSNNPFIDQFDKTKTAAENIENNGIRKIYDSGNFKCIWRHQ